MNLVDYVILGIIGISLLFGFYRGFVSSVLNTGGCLASFAASFWLSPKLADMIRGNPDLLMTLMNYTDASSRVGDQTLALKNVSTLSGDVIQTILQKVSLPEPLNTLLKVNLENQVFAPSGLNTVQNYVQQTILSASINIICYVVCFIGAYIVISIVINLIRAVFRFPLLKQLDTLAGGIFGLLRGVLLCFVAFSLLPLVQTMVPPDMISTLVSESTLAPVFNNGSLILSIMNGHF